MTDNLAAALVKGVPRYDTDPNDYTALIKTDDGDWLSRDEVLAALLTANAALRAERDRYLRHLTAGAESLNAYKARAEAAESEVEKLRGALVDLTAAFAKKVDVNSTRWRMPYEHPLSAYDRAMDLLAALTETATTEERHDVD